MLHYTANYSYKPNPAILFGVNKKQSGYKLADDYIEIPGGSDTVPYTDDEGNQYEIPLDDLIEYDGDDGEIQYTSGKTKMSIGRFKRKKKQINAVLQCMARSRVYS